MFIPTYASLLLEIVLFSHKLRSRPVAPNILHVSEVEVETTSYRHGSTSFMNVCVKISIKSFTMGNFVEITSKRA
jgi:glycosylphosphatidylinositol transamidase (GPIT) subunit GPI8